MYVVATPWPLTAVDWAALVICVLLACCVGILLWTDRRGK